jgi:pimeloyl-ACP methyl ester carboxylesterase
MIAVATVVRRTIKLIVAILGVTVAVGATYQGVATSLERRDTPAPGTLIDIGSHQLHLVCAGDGSPTIVLEAPETGLSAAWARVMPGLAERTRVCAYDRSGLGWSEASGRPFEPQQVPEELHQLLAAASIKGPIVLAGQSLGAAYARLYAARYPGNVAALATIDEPRFITAPPDLAWTLRWSAWLSRTGLLRLTGQVPSKTNGIPEPSGRAMRTFLYRPDHLTRAAQEVAQWSQTVNLAKVSTLHPLISVVQVSTPGHVVGSLLTSSDSEARTTVAILALVGETTEP